MNEKDMVEIYFSHFFVVVEGAMQCNVDTFIMSTWLLMLPIEPKYLINCWRCLSHARVTTELWSPHPGPDSMAAMRSIGPSSVLYTASWSEVSHW